MQDKISSLARRLIRSEEPREFVPVAAELRREIHECVRRVQLRAIRMVTRSRRMAEHTMGSAQSYPGQTCEKNR